MGDDSLDIDSYTIELSDITLGGYSADSITIDEYYPYTPWDDAISQNNIILNGGGEEMLRVAPDGFYVRGVRIEADEKEAIAVYEAFKKWMTWAIINGEQ